MKDSLLFARRLAALVTLALCMAPPLASAQGFKWWQSERFQRELQLTTDQIDRIEQVFQAYLTDARDQKKKTLDRLEEELERLIESADEVAVMQQADRVEAVRSELSKERTRMLVRIRQVLTEEQRAKLAELHQEWQRNRRRQDRRH